MKYLFIIKRMRATHKQLAKRTREREQEKEKQRNRARARARVSEQQEMFA